jgi:hypothetical protein
MMAEPSRKPFDENKSQALGQKYEEYIEHTKHATYTEVTQYRQVARVT